MACWRGKTGHPDSLHLGFLCSLAHNSSNHGLAFETFMWVFTSTQWPQRADWGGYTIQELSVGRPPFCSAVIWSCNWTTIPEQMASSPPPNPCSHYKKVLSKQPLRELLWNNKQPHCHVQNSDPALQEMKCSSVNLPAQRPHTISKPALELPVSHRPPVNRAWWNGSSLSRSLFLAQKRLGRVNHGLTL